MLRNVYLDSGAYHSKNVAFTASFAASTGTLTVSAMEPGSDPIMIGMRVIFPLLDYYCYISSFGTGTGGVGTYTMSSGSTTSSGGQQPMQGEGGMPSRENPVWGVAQEGDGLLPGLAVPAVTSINLTGVSAAAGARLYIAGAELVCISPGTSANQFAPSSGAALAATLVAAINRAANTVTVNPAGEGWWATHKLQDAVIARIDPNNSSIVQLMTRAGSAAYNNNPLFSVTYAATGWTGLSGGPLMFTGGLSGAWGTPFGLNVTMFASSIAAFNYGLFSPIFPLAGSVLPGDTIVCRGHSRNFGATIFLFNNPNTTAQPSFSGTEDLPVIVTNDDGAVWPADGPEPVFEVLSRATSTSQFWRYGPAYNSYIYTKGKRYPSGKNGIRFTVTSPSVLDTPRMALRVGGLVGYENIDLYGKDYGMPYFQDPAQAVPNPIGRTQVRGCLVSWLKQRSTGSMLALDTATYDHGIDMDDCVFELREADAPQIGVFSMFAGGGGNGVKAVMRGITFKGFRPGSTLISVPNLSSVNIQSMTYMLNCDFGGITNFAPNFREGVRNQIGYGLGVQGLFISSMYGRNLTVIDTHIGTVLWNPQQDQPCLNARLNDNSSWSYRLIPSRQSSNITYLNPLDTPIFTKTLTVAAGKKRLTANFLMEKGMKWRNYDVAVLVSYIDTTGVVRSEVSTDRTNRALLPSVGNLNVWTRPGGATAMAIDPADDVERVMFNDGGLNLFFEQYQLNVTTRYPVRAGSEVSMIFRVARSATYDTDQIFVDPDVQIQDVLP